MNIISRHTFEEKQIHIHRRKLENLFFYIYLNFDDVCKKSSFLSSGATMSI